jgi:hypothetical protein
MGMDRGKLNKRRVKRGDKRAGKCLYAGERGRMREKENAIERRRMRKRGDWCGNREQYMDKIRM